jgi:hypothetical protein
VLLFPNCTLLRASRIEHHCHFAGTSHNVLLRPAVSSHCYRDLRLGLDWRSFPMYFSFMGGPGSRPRGAIHRLQGSFQLHRLNCHTESLLVRCYPSCKGLVAVAPRSAAVALPHHPVAAGGASNPMMHRGQA